MQLIVDNKTLNYAHGPEQPIAYKWPFDVSASVTSLTVNTFTGERHMIDSSGPWAIFHLLKQAKAYLLSDKSGYRMAFNMNGVGLGLKITTDAPLAAFTLAHFNHLQVPNKLSMR